MAKLECVRVADDITTPGINVLKMNGRTSLAVTFVVTVGFISSPNMVSGCHAVLACGRELVHSTWNAFLRYLYRFFKKVTSLTILLKLRSLNTHTKIHLLPPTFPYAIFFMTL